MHYSILVPGGFPCVPIAHLTDTDQMNDTMFDVSP